MDPNKLNALKVRVTMLGEAGMAVLSLAAPGVRLVVAGFVFRALDPISRWNGGSRLRARHDRLPGSVKSSADDIEALWS
jgi:hypothetical protein